MNIAILDNPESQAAYLRTLPAIRERCGRVHELAKEGKLQYFDYHPEKEGDVADFCVEIMKVSSITSFYFQLWLMEPSSATMGPTSRPYVSTIVFINYILVTVSPLR